MIELLKHDRRARVFYAAHAQSSFGTGAAYVALLLVAYERFPSPWAITLILLAEFLPAMFLGPLVGAAADRFPRRTCLVIADGTRAAAFLGLALVGSFPATIVLALLAGVGNALFNPTIMAALPGLVERERLPAATSLHGAINEAGYTAGPAVAALAFLWIDAGALMLVNAASFAVSAAALSTLTFGDRPRGRHAAGSAPMLRAAWEGMKHTAGQRGTRTLLLASTAFVLCLGMVNVAELLFAREALHAGDTEFSLLVAAMGVGIVLGSLYRGGRGPLPVLKRRYLAGILLGGGGLIAAGTAPAYPIALVAFAAVGVGNGVALLHERVLLQTTIADELLGRVFGVKNALVSWSFALSFLSAGALAAALGARAVLVIAGVGALAAWAVAARALRGVWCAGPGEAETAVAAGLGAVTAALPTAAPVDVAPVGA
jgi:Transmembrane secretion effector